MLHIVEVGPGHALEFCQNYVNASMVRNMKCGTAFDMLFVKSLIAEIRVSKNNAGIKHPSFETTNHRLEESRYLLGSCTRGALVFRSSTLTNLTGFRRQPHDVLPYVSARRTLLQMYFGGNLHAVNDMFRVPGRKKPSG